MGCWIMAVLLTALAGFACWCVYIRHLLVHDREECDLAWEKVDANLKRRYNSVKGIAGVIKEAAPLERKITHRVVKARRKAIEAKTLKDRLLAERVMVYVLRPLIDLGNGLRGVGGTAGYDTLLEELKVIESLIDNGQKNFNAAVATYNGKLRKFPSNIIGRMIGFFSREEIQIALYNAQPVDAEVDLGDEEGGDEGDE